MNNDSQIRIPTPQIRFDGKKALKRRSTTARIVWISLSSAAAIAISIALIAPTLTTLPDENPASQVAVLQKVATPIAKDTSKMTTIQNNNSGPKSVTQPARTTRLKYVPKTPPPEENEIETKIEQIRRRELPADIPVQLKSCIAQVDVPQTIHLTTNSDKPKPDFVIITNPNITDFIKNLKPQENTFSDIKALFNREEKEQDYKVIHLFSKNR